MELCEDDNEPSVSQTDLSLLTLTGELDVCESQKSRKAELDNSQPSDNILLSRV